MDYIERMLNRANTHQIAGYLMYGTDTLPESDYDNRLNEGFKKLREIAEGNDKMLSQLNEVINVFSDVYMELGFRTGIMFMAEVFCGTGKVPGKGGRFMTIGTAKWIFENIEDEKYSDTEKMEAIKLVVNMGTHNSTTKNEILEAIKWIMEYEKRGWIPVNDGKAPSEDGLYLLTVLNDDGYKVGAIRNDGNWKSCIDVEGKVIAWKKPRPYIPFEESGGE